MRTIPFSLVMEGSCEDHCHGYVNTKEMLPLGTLETGICCKHRYNLIDLNRVLMGERVCIYLNGDQISSSDYIQVTVTRHFIMSWTFVSGKPDWHEHHYIGDLYQTLFLMLIGHYIYTTRKFHHYLCDACPTCVETDTKTIITTQWKNFVWITFREKYYFFR